MMDLNFFAYIFLAIPTNIFLMHVMKKITDEI